MNARDFLAVGRQMLQSTTEAAWRSAVSRGYYAAFHVTREWFEQLGFSVPRGERAHAYLWRRLSNAGNARLEKAGRQLNSPRGQRNKADYDLASSFSHLKASGELQDAERVIESLDSVLLAPTRPQIIDTIKTYERDVLKEPTWRA